MILIVLGILLLIAYSIVGKMIPNPKIANILRIVSLVFIIGGVLSKSIKQINPGEVGVKILFGKVQNEVLYSGLNFINPLLDIERVDVKTQNYTMSGIHDEGDQQGDDAIRVLSSDGLEVIIDLTVLYRVIPEEAPDIIKKLGSNFTSKIVRPVTRTRIRDNAVYYDAVSLYSRKRDEFQQKIFKSIENDLKKRGIFLEQLLIRNINLPQSVKETIESKINAEQEAQKMEFVLQKEKQEAERKRVEAQGIFDYQKLINASLSNNLIRFETIKAYKEMATSPNAKIIIMGDGKNPVILDGK